MIEQKRPDKVTNHQAGPNQRGEVTPRWLKPIIHFVTPFAPCPFTGCGVFTRVIRRRRSGEISQKTAYVSWGIYVASTGAASLGAVPFQKKRGRLPSELTSPDTRAD